MKTNLTSKKPCTYPCTRKLFITLLIIFSTLMLDAQTLTTFERHSDNYIQCWNLVETSDNNIVIDCPIFDNITVEDIGHVFYKVNLQGELIDTLFIEDHHMNGFSSFLSKNKVEENSFVLAEVFRIDYFNYMRIITFNNNLDILSDSIVTLAETKPMQNARIIHDKNNDIIASWYRATDSTLNFARYGLDGTLKCFATPIKKNLEKINIDGLFSNHQSPVEYRISATPPMAITNYFYTVDSLFNLVNEHVIDYLNGSSYISTKVVSGDYLSNDRILISTVFMDHTFEERCQTILFNRDYDILNTFEFYNGESVSYPPSISYNSIDIVDSNNLYHYCMTKNMANNQIVITRLNADLSVQWQRYCYNEETFYWAYGMKTLENGGAAVCGWHPNIDDNEWRNVFLLILDNEGWSTPEMEDFVKPYLVYPNPCKDKINIHISPDIAFEKAELYDMSGRLVKAQESGFENIDINGIASGTYILKLRTQNGKVYDEKVVVE